jgi:hypothetical protein
VPKGPLGLVQGKFALVANKPLTGFKRGTTQQSRVILIMGREKIIKNHVNLKEDLNLPTFH